MTAGVLPHGHGASDWNRHAAYGIGGLLVSGCRHRLRFGAVPRVFLWAGLKPLTAMVGAEVIGLAGLSGRVRGLDLHPAHRVECVALTTAAG